MTATHPHKPVQAAPAPNMDRCCMGYPLGDDCRCWNQAGDELWCPTCHANNLGQGPRCECGGCQAAYAFDEAHAPAVLRTGDAVRDVDDIRARLATATSGLTPGPTRVNWAGSPGWFLPDTLITHLLAELDHADRLNDQQADRIDQLEGFIARQGATQHRILTAGQALADALRMTHPERSVTWADNSPVAYALDALAGWEQATGHAKPAITP